MLTDHGHLDDAEDDTAHVHTEAALPPNRPPQESRKQPMTETSTPPPGFGNTGDVPTPAKKGWKSWSTKRKVLVCSGGAFAFFLLVGMCAGDPDAGKGGDPAPSTASSTSAAPTETVTETPETVTETATASTPPPPSPTALSPEIVDQLFLNEVEKVGITVLDPDIAVALGHGVCASFEEGMSLEQLGFQLMAEADLTASQSGKFMGLAVGAYCPRFGYVFDQ